MEGSANDRLRKNAWRNISFTVMAQCLLIVVSLLILADVAFCLRMVMLDVPSAVNHGESVELSCIYELENDRLYSIKWYRNDVEFYRYVPNDWPPGQFLPLPGVRVDLSKSGQRSVYLRSVDLNSTGTYRCEVSAEAPSFQSVEAERDMKVMVLPTEGPKIMGGQTQYNVGDMVAVNCTSAKSKPAATLRWFINDNAVGPEYETEYSTTLHEDGLESSSLSLRFVAKDKHFVNQNMRLRCTASISRIYTMSNEEMFVGGRQQSSPLQITENGSKEKPLKSPPNPKRKQPKQLQSSSDGSVFSFCHWLLVLSVLMLHLRIT
ncbi:cell adhesion molecule 1-like isoform X2 [Argiope bruennichi]|uniref:cell adhesion molecule 1-like isoform X2 n=1 Tax=Argiope bruennichi TaxID=94029 RepID=UPI00249573BB|nr:cell adhesion molecule 1-like isoform X2 [Argiope bruennichi]